MTLAYNKCTMTLFQRRILALIFIFGFAFLTPAVIFYAAGYRYNFKQKRVEQLGLLHVTTEPNNTKLLLNSQTYDIDRELVLKSLRPGEVNVVIQKDDYHPWTKELEIESGKSTFIRDLVLFKDEEAEKVNEYESKLKLLYADDEVSFFQSQFQLIRLNYESGEEIRLRTEDSSDISRIELNPDNSLMVFSQNNTWYGADFGDQTLKSIAGVLPPSTSKVKFLNYDLIAINDEGAWQIFPDEGFTPLSLIKQPLTQEVAVNDEGYWLIAAEPSKQRSFLYSFSSASSRSRLMTSLPYSPDYRIVDDYRGFLTIHDRENNALHLADTQNTSTHVVTLNDVHTFQWSDDHTQLLTATDFELNIHHIQNGNTQELLLRISTPIDETLWHPSENHVFYRVDDRLMLIERDARDIRNIITLDEKKDLMVLGADSDGENIWYASSDDSATSVWKLNIL